MSDRPKRFIFLVQGEGRGHMTQAIGLYQILKNEGHEIVHIFIGTSKRRKVPLYFTEAFDIDVEPLDSPNFISDPENKSIRLLNSVFYNLQFLNLYRKSIVRIHQVVKKTRADGIVNFYDFLGGFYNFFYGNPIKFFAIGHQFLTDHPDFPFAGGRPLDKTLFLINNYVNSLGAYKKIALSFRPYAPEKIGKMVVTPPILRREIFDHPPSEENFLLGYMVNDGYSKEIIRWHLKYPEIPIHCFWDKKDEPGIKKIDNTLFFHQLDGTKFLDYMARCKGLMTTAGFESVCEAMLLGKPVLMVPVSGQYEQACNAIDASLAGAGIHDNSFNIRKFMDFIADYRSVKDFFMEWVSKASGMLLRELTDF
jgi:uncharacterized protein (TIGR00661 family)